MSVAGSLPVCHDGLVTSPPPARRSDAEANRSRILQVARRAFADPAADVSMAELARLAGIGSATLYRNFGTRRELLAALYSHEVDALCDAAAAPSGPTVGAGLLTWLRRFGDYYIEKGVVAAGLLEHTDESDPVFSSGYARIVAAGAPLLGAAQDSGEVRADLDVHQVLALVAAVARIPGDPAFRGPLVTAALDALRPPRPGTGDPAQEPHGDAAQEGQGVQIGGHPSGVRAIRRRLQA